MMQSLTKQKAPPFPHQRVDEGLRRCSFDRGTAAAWCCMGYTSSRGGHRRARKPQKISLNILYAGQGRLECADGRSWPLAPGSRYLSLPDQAYTLLGEPGCWQEVHVTIDRHTSARILDAGLITREPLVLTAAITGERRRLIDACWRLLAGPRPKASRLLLTFLQLIEAWQTTTEEVRPGGSIDRAMEEIATLLRDDGSFGISDIARDFALPMSTLRRRFRARFGCSPRNYRLRHRMLLAEELLEDHSVTAVAQRLGYSDPFVFSNLFRRHMGSPPSHLRR